MGFPTTLSRSAYVVLFPELFKILHRFNLIATPMRQDILNLGVFKIKSKVEFGTVEIQLSEQVIKPLTRQTLVK